MSDTYTIDCCAGIPQSPAPPSQRQVPSQNGSAESDRFRFAHPGDSVYRGSRAHFEATETDRLNEAHWQNATDTPVNDVLSWQLATMRTRANHEAINNPTMEGLILEHTLAVAGEDGPLIDLQAEDEAGDAWCEEAEQLWEAWCTHADASGDLTLTGLLKQWNCSGWRNGEWLEQIVNCDKQFSVAGIPDVRLHGIETQRLVSPFESTADRDVVLGIRRNKHRRPLAYWISDDYFAIGKGNWYQAANIMHGFDRVQAERGQARGIPWCHTGLPVAADLRDYDTQVMDAARNAADMALFAYTQHPDADFASDVPSSVEYRRRRLNHLAPGWQLGNTQANQPAATYKDHRHERMGDLGKGKGVPSMITRLDARDHNYSSARFDYQMLGESAKHLRATLYNPTLMRLAMMVIREAQLMGIIRPSPRRFTMQWVWPSLPEIDELKSAAAETQYMQNGTLSYSAACARRHGRRGRDVARQRQRDNRMLREFDLPTVEESFIKKTESKSGDTTDPAADPDKET